MRSSYGGAAEFGLDDVGAPPSWRPVRTTYQGPRKRSVRLCGVGRSSVPSCTPWLEAGCQRANGRATHELAWDGSTLDIKVAGAMTEEEEAECTAERRTLRVVLP